jgi:SAM-dependent methyltransferase
MHAALIKPDDPGLPEAGVDLVIVVDTWHHIDERVSYLAKVGRGLKAGGRVAIVDFKKGSLPVGPPDEHKLAPDQIVDEFKRAGWSVVRRDEELLPYQYVLVFAPRAR